MHRVFFVCGHGAWGMEHGAWSMEHGAWRVEGGAWSKIKLRITNFETYLHFSLSELSALRSALYALRLFKARVKLFSEGFHVFH